MQRVFGRAVDETHRPESPGNCGGLAVGWRSISGQLLRAQAMVALSDLWSDWRDRARAGLHRSDYGFGEMVSRSPGTHHRHRGGWVRRGIIVLSACGWMADSACR